MLIPIYQHVYIHYLPRLPESTHARITGTVVITNMQQALKDLKSLLVTMRNIAPRKCMIQNQFVHGECLPITMHNSSNS